MRTNKYPARAGGSKHDPRSRNNLVEEVLEAGDEVGDTSHDLCGVGEQSALGGGLAEHQRKPV